MRRIGPAYALAAVAAAVLVLYRTDHPLDATDWFNEAWSAYRLLLEGEVGDAWQNAPAYLGFVVLIGAPAALLADAVGLGPYALFQLTALPGAVALAGLGGWLAERSRQAGSDGWMLYAVVVAGSPIAWSALYFGHPEDLLAAGCAVAAVLAGWRDHPRAAAALLIAAVLTKQWALLAAPAVMLALPRRGLVVGAAAAGVAGGLTLLQVLTHHAARGVLTTTGDRFHTRQVWWPLGGDPAPGTRAALFGERASPEWLVHWSHPLVVAAGFGLCAVWWWHARGRERSAADVLTLLATVFALRVLLDPWNVPYYALALVLSLAALELALERRAPWVTLGVTAATVLSFRGWQQPAGNETLDWVLYMAFMAPLLGWLLWRLFRGPKPGPAGPHARA